MKKQHRISGFKSLRVQMKTNKCLKAAQKLERQLKVRNCSCSLSILVIEWYHSWCRSFQVTPRLTSLYLMIVAKLVTSCAARCAAYSERA